MPKKKTSANKNLVDKAHDSLMAKSPLYSDWHKHPHQHKVQMIIFIMVLFIFGGLFALRYQGFEKVAPLTSKADQDQYWMDQESKIADSTKNLLNLVQDYRKADSDEKAELLPMIVDTAQQRFYMVAAAAEKKPDVVLHTAIPGVIRKNIPAEAAQYVEQDTTQKGKLDWKVADDFSTDTAKNEISLIAQQNQFDLEFGTGAALPHAQSGDTVSVNGILVNNHLVVKTATDSIQVLGATTPPQVKKVAVILFNFQNNPGQPYSPDDARSVVFTGANSVNKFYQENSFGEMSLTGSLRSDGDVFGWYTLPATYNGVSIGWNMDCPGNFASSWTTLAEQAAARDGFVASNYTNIIYGFPQGQCGWAGIAVVGGSPARAWIDDNGITQVGQPTFLPVGTVTHEFGHNLGRMHASLLNCVDATGARVSISTNCTNASEYGDSYDVMGRWGAMRGMHAFHKGIASPETNTWLAPSNTQTVSSGTNTYSIAPIETSTDGLQSLRIPKAITIGGAVYNGYYYLDFRQPIGYDVGSPTDPIYNGVSIHFGTDYNVAAVGYMNSFLIDTTPATNDWSDAPLAAGQTFVDPSNNTTVTVQSISAAGAVVTVSYTGNPCSGSNPTITATPTSASAAAGLSVTYTYTLKDNNSSTCGVSYYDVSSSLPSGWTQTPATVTEALAPGASITRTIVITSDPNASSGNVVIPIKAQRENSTNIGQTSVTYAVQGVDRTAPVPRIISPSNGASVGKGKLNISTSATDNVFVTSIKVYIDNTLLKTCVNTGSCSASANVNQLSKGAHTIKAVASDYAGNSATASIAVTK